MRRTAGEITMHSQTARPKLTLLALAAVGVLTLASPALAEFKLTILHTNDVHSRIEPINAQDSTCGEKDAAEKACFGGTARLATAIARERAAANPTLLLDAGDQFQGSLFYTHYKGMEVAELMGTLGYEAMAIGNHEFDDGAEGLEAFAARVPFPLLMANADLSKVPALGTRIRGSTVIEKGAERIGVIGLAPENTQELASPGSAIAFLDPVEAVRNEVKSLTADGITKIVVLSHSGIEVEKRIAEAVGGVDVIVGGHSHTLLSNTAEGASGPYPLLIKGPGGRAVPIVQAGSSGKYLGRLEVSFDESGQVTQAVGDPILLDASIAEDAAIKARIAKLAEPLAALRSEVVAEAAAVIDGSREVCRTAECAMGTLVADAMLDRGAAQGVTIAITNGGGLRASIDAGEITMGEILTVLPFQNTLSTFELKGSEVVEALENGVSQVSEGSGRFPQVAGLEFEWSPAAEPGAGRIKAARVRAGTGWTPIDPAATYRVVSNNFLRRGGDGYRVFADKGQNAYDHGPTLDSVLVDYLAKQAGPYLPYTDGRIKRAE